MEIESITLEAPDPTIANVFYTTAFGLDDAHVRVRASAAPTAGFRGCVLSLVVSQPSTVDSLIGAALDGGATALKSARKGFWGYGGVVQAPDGAVWKVARRPAPPSRLIRSGKGLHRLLYSQTITGQSTVKDRRLSLAGGTMPRNLTDMAEVRFQRWNAVHEALIRATVSLIVLSRYYL